MKILRFFVPFVCTIFFVAGCVSTMEKLDKCDEYKKSSPHNDPLVIPKDLNSSVIEDHYPMPEVKCKDEIHSSVVPPGSQIGK